MHAIYGMECMECERIDIKHCTENVWNVWNLLGIYRMDGECVEFWPKVMSRWDICFLMSLQVQITIKI